MLYNLGCAWFHIGELRFELLLSSYGIDPAMKYAFKHSHALEKTSLVELDMKVFLFCYCFAFFFYSHYLLPDVTHIYCKIVGASRV